MIKYFYTFFVGFFIFSVSAQRIVVVDATSLEPIPGVVVYNLVKTKTNISNLDGKASIVRFQSFERIYFQHLSYRTKSGLKSKLNDTIFLAPKATDLNEIVISASKFEQSKKEVPQKIITLNANDIELANPQTSADLLANTGRVFIQKSQLGGGSPMIRGFSTNRVLITVDGVRLNNAIFRSGNVQNIISINPFNIQKTEVILGAGSVIYGSDAIGGVMNFYTTSPKISESGTPEISTKSNLRYASANNERTLQFGLNLGLKKWGLHSSLSFSDFGDLKMGKTSNDAYLTPFYVSQRNGQDMLMPNHEPLLQKGTSFSQFHAAQKIHYKANENLTFDLGLHFATTSNIPRYDRLTLRQDNSNALQFSEWNYGPQQWFLANLQLTKLSSRSPFYDKIKASMAYQNFEESRISRKFGANDRKTRTETVDALSLNLDLEKSLSYVSNLSYGAEFIYNTIGSVGISKEIETNSIQHIASRYPDGAQWSSFASYLSFKYKPSSKLTFQSGIRYNDVSIATDLTTNNEFYDLPFTTANLHTNALTGTAGFTWEQSQTFLWKFNLTTAFRAPNIDDIGKVFDSEPGSVVVPNNQLKPEHAYGGELGLTINFNDSAVLDLSAYYTHLDNAMTRDAFNINGVTEINYDGVSSTVQAVQNNAQANIYGFEAGFQARLTKDIEITSQFSLTKGRQKNTHNAEVPVRHVAPAFGNAHLLWKHKKITLDGFINYSAGLTYKDISHELSNHLFAIDANGNPYAPAWMTFNIRAQYQFTENISFVSALENISNEGYRPFASGISGPGTHLIFAITYKN